MVERAVSAVLVCLMLHEKYLNIFSNGNLGIRICKGDRVNGVVGEDRKL